jgi:hypothetical protein
MEHSENYVDFGIVSGLTGFWHAAALLLILQHQAFGDLSGPFLNVSGSAGAGPSGTVDFFTGKGTEGQNVSGGDSPSVLRLAPMPRCS